MPAELAQETQTAVVAEQGLQSAVSLPEPAAKTAEVSADAPAVAPAAEQERTAEVADEPAKDEASGEASERKRKSEVEGEAVLPLKKEAVMATPDALSPTAKPVPTAEAADDSAAVTSKSEVDANGSTHDIPAAPVAVE